MTDSGSIIKIGENEYELILTTRATKEIAKRYGGLENLGDRLMKSENIEMALDEIVYLRNSEKKQLLSEETVEFLTSPGELAEYKDAITEAMMKGTKRNVESEDTSKNAVTAE